MQLIFPVVNRQMISLNVFSFQKHKNKCIPALYLRTYKGQYVWADVSYKYIDKIIMALGIIRKVIWSVRESFWYHNAHGPVGRDRILIIVYISIPNNNFILNQVRSKIPNFLPICDQCMVWCNWARAISREPSLVATANNKSRWTSALKLTV